MAVALFRRKKAVQSEESADNVLPADMVRRVRRVEIRTRRLVHDVFLGQYHSAFRGRGIEFYEVREYQPGDDIRIIDWNVTARMGSPYVKKFTEERELTVYLLVDVSASQGFSTTPQTKRELAAEIAALLAFAAIRNNDKVGLILFAGDVEKFIAPKKGLQHALRLIREVLYHRPASRGTSIANAVNLLSRIARRRSVVFILSDFWDQGYEPALRRVARRHDVIALVISDPRETELPAVGIIEVEDAETGERLLIDTDNPRTRRLYADAIMQEQERRRRALRLADVDAVNIATDRSYVEPLMALFRTRAQRR